MPYVHERKQFGKAIGQFQLIQGKIADIYTKLASARALTYSTARRIDGTGKIDRHLAKDCASCILFAAENATQVALDGIQILGGKTPSPLSTLHSPPSPIFAERS